MKNMLLKELTLEEQSNINKVTLWLTLILLICSVVMRIFGVYADFNASAASLLAIICLGAFSFEGAKKRDLRTVCLAVFIVGDAMYVLFLFFLLGRTFMQHLL
ncbi:MAG: hypothetical protein K2H90_07420 [Oscillospiraceae bacterium]|nr:hypothetical protein [Oscillospiraceae bacterium]MDE6132397.1 hypothetical protein [Oscillospiraceae bacterium]